MKYLFSGATICTHEGESKQDILVEDGIIVAMEAEIPAPADCTVIHCENRHIFPGFVDVHVHLREPGFSYKETIKTGTLSGARGGYSALCTMPNLKPAPDTLENLDIQRKLIAEDAVIGVYPSGTITMGEKGHELSHMEDMAPFVIGFTDDGRGVQNDAMMRAAMEKATSLGKIIIAHCEDESLLHGGYIHDGDYAKAHGHLGICSESEWGQVKRDLELVEELGASYHICHVSTKETVELVRGAKARGVDVTCETAPHYLVLTDADLQEDGRFKMNPPIRSKADQDALRAGLKDGTVDMIATDHAPHGFEEKAKGLKGSMMGVVGLETAFPMVYTHLVKTGIFTLAEIIDRMTKIPGERFACYSPLKVGAKANLTVFDLEENYVVNPEDFMTQGRATPFTGMAVFGACHYTMYEGKLVWDYKA